MPSEELAKRVVYAFMYATARLADQFENGWSLKAAGRDLQMAWFHVLRARGLKQHQIAERLSISRASVAGLSRRLKANFLQAGNCEALQRRIEFMLWAEPLSRSRLHQVLTDCTAEAIDVAIEQLEQAGRITLQTGRTPRYVTARATRLARDGAMARLDGLGQLVGAVSQAAFSRFFTPERAAFARVSQLRVRREDLPQLRALYEHQIWPTLTALDAAADGVESAQALEFVVTWSPHALFEEQQEEAR
jgi:predicted XRE-type DNA-binding protein